MRYEFQDKAWAEERHHLAGAIHKLIEDIGTSFARLNAIQFDAPWQDKPACRNRLAPRSGKR